MCPAPALTPVLSLCISPALLPTAGGGRSDVVAYSLPAPSEEAGDEPLQNEEGHYAFQLQELRAAGTYSAVG